MGDYPDHRASRPGSRKEDHFKLKKFRALNYTQNANQKLWTLIAAHRIGLPGFEGSPLHALDEFRSQYGFKPGLNEFIAWYKKVYATNYALVF